MRLFKCPKCSATVHFENSVCSNCGTGIGYDPVVNAMVAVGPQTFYCSNASHMACNWIVPEVGLCRACVHNETIPDLSDSANLEHWQTIERAKKRLFYSLLRLGLPLITRAEDSERGLGFRFLADVGNEPAMTGHEDGMITIALVEADDAERERRRSGMGEPYRTLLGHFRHEIAHYYWDVLVWSTDMLTPTRNIFGDDSAGYSEALEAHYANGAPPDWPERFVSTYASAHPWEDFAETWAHYFHIVDTMETAGAFGLTLSPGVDTQGELSAQMDFDPYRRHAIETLIEHWIPLSVALNSLNRSVGRPDAYPFVLTPPIIEKLGFIATIIHDRD